MKYLLLFLSFVCVSSFATVLPSEFGSEVSLVSEGVYKLKENKIVQTSTHLDLVTTKVMKDKAQLSASAVLGDEDRHVSASFFYKINPYFSIGASSFSSTSFEFDGAVTFIGRFPYKDFLYLPYITLNDIRKKESRTGVLGMKVYYKDLGAVIFSVMRPEQAQKDSIYFSFGFAIPIHNVKILDFLFD